MLSLDDDDSNHPIPVIQLNDDNELPVAGVVGFRNDSIDDTRNIVFDKLSEGLRHFEITELFGNGFVFTECILGARGFPREKCFFTLKLWPKQRKSNEIIQACKDTLRLVGLQYVDLLLMHAPIDMANRLDQWVGFETLKSEGFAKSIGIANASFVSLSQLLKNCLVCPAVLEVELSAFGQRREVLHFCHDNAVTLLCSDPVAKGVKMKNPELTAIAEQLQLTPEQVMIRWVISKGYAVLIPPNSSYMSASGEQAFERLPADVMQRLDALEEGLRTGWEISDFENIEDAF